MLRIHAPDLTSAILERIAETPDQVIMTFQSADGASYPYTYRALHAKALAGAGRLREASVGPGDIVALFGRHDADLVTGFLAVLLVGATPTIGPYRSAFNHVEVYRQRLMEIARSAGAKAILTEPDTLSWLAGQAAGTALLGISPTTGEDVAGACPNILPSPSSPAYIQFSSGTTGRAKGTVVSHAAIVAHLNQHIRVHRLDEPSVLVGWVPFNHDLGLVSYLLTPLACGVPVVTIPPDTWVRRPLSMLRALHNHRNATCHMPNFGFAHIARNVSPNDLGRLDLSHVSQLVAVAEVIQAETLDDFMRLLRCTGLRDEMLRVAYGMAECVLGATATPMGVAPHVDRISARALSTDRIARPSSDRDALSVVSCGVPYPDVTITILDEDGTILPERRIGEVVIESRTLFEAYINRPDLTADALRNGRLHSGDLGYLADGELYIVDRKKDLIISAGKNIDPEPVERVAMSVLGKAAGRAAAFGVRNKRLGTELPVLVCERRGTLGAGDESRLVADIRRHVRNMTDITLEDIRLVRRGWLVKTTSGKISRSGTREKYLREYPNADHAWGHINARDHDVLTERLATHFGELLGVESVDGDASFFDLGGDSLSILSLSIHIEETYGTRVSMEEFCIAPTAANLAGIIIESKSAENPITTSNPPASALHGEKPSQRILQGLAGLAAVRGARSLAYGSGVRVQRALLAMPWVQRTYFANEVEVIQRWGDLLGEHDCGETIVRHLMTNTMTSWRHAMLANQVEESRWVTLAGDPALLRAEPSQVGTIYLIMHTPLSRLFKAYLAEISKSIFSLGLSHTSVDTKKRLSIKVERAYRILRQGGNVILAGDGQHGRKHLTVPFFGSNVKFMLGGAELAVHTGARLVPVFACLDTDGRVAFEIGPALTTASGSDHERTTAMTLAYAEQVIARWPRIHACLDTWKLRQWLPKKGRHGRTPA